MTENLMLLLLIALLITIREGFQQRDILVPDPAVSFAWHLYGWMIRFFVFSLLFRLGATFWMLVLSVFIMWPLYNIACNIGRKNKWYYLSDKGLDGIIRKMLPFINFNNKTK
jgi:hypothetical protein